MQRENNNQQGNNNQQANNNLYNDAFYNFLERMETIGQIDNLTKQKVKLMKENKLDKFRDEQMIGL